MNFNIKALQSNWTPLFKLICSKLIPTTYTSYITLNRAILLYEMIKKKNVDIGWIIYNSMIDLVTLWIWFPAIIAQLCIKSSVEAERNEEKIKVGLAISSKASSDTPQFGSQNVGVEILEELKEIKDMQKNLVTFMDYQHKWNMFMERKFQANQINIYGVPTHKGFIFARTSKFTGMKKKWRTRRCQGANNNTEKKKKDKEYQGIHCTDATPTTWRNYKRRGWCCHTSGRSRALD